jgi:hypothetical protein
METGQLKSALRAVWTIVSLSALIPLALPFVLPPTSIIALAQRLVIPHDQPCVLCGMTRSFILISHGQFAQAFYANRLSLPLYALLALSATTAVIYVVYGIWRWSRRARTAIAK